MCRPSPSYFEPDYDEADARAALAQYVADVLGTDARRWRGAAPFCDLPARALLDAAEDAALLVVGARAAAASPASSSAL